MFFSTDLLTPRGKFNLIWLVATMDKQATIKRKKKELLALNLDGVCKELAKMLPVQGKEKSLSLRTSAILTHGLFITFRLQADELRLNILRLRESSSKSRSISYEFYFLVCIEFSLKEWSRLSTT